MAWRRHVDRYRGEAALARRASFAHSTAGVTTWRLFIDNFATRLEREVTRMNRRWPGVASPSSIMGRDDDRQAPPHGLHGCHVGGRAPGPVVDVVASDCRAGDRTRIEPLR